MRSSVMIFVVGILFIVITDGTLWYQLRKYIHKRYQIILYSLHTLFFLLALIMFQYGISRLKGPGAYFWIEKFIGLFFLFYVPKLFFILFNGISILLRSCCLLFSKSLRMLATFFSLSLFLILLYSITLGRYNYKLETVEVPIAYLSEAFRNFKIVQLSDIHLGSFGPGYKGMEKLVDQVNQLQPDVIVFTGDMVNNFADEMIPWIDVLGKLHAPYGKYAVTGNHDYGDYTHWPDTRAKQNNMTQFFRNMEAMGFRMLNNRSIPLVIRQDTLWLAGVENWGKPPFPRYGKLTEAIDSIQHPRPIVLLSHDPSHWRAEILDHPNIYLTLSGHTHAMQFGIKIGPKKWSPASYIYPEYDGLYQQGDQYLHVSRGQGYLGYPGRIGLSPVITELILTTGK